MSKQEEISGINLHSRHCGDIFRQIVVCGPPKKGFMSVAEFEVDEFLHPPPYILKIIVIV